MHDIHPGPELYLEQFLRDLGWSSLSVFGNSLGFTRGGLVSESFQRNELESSLRRINNHIEWTPSQISDFFSMIEDELVSSSKHISNSTLSAEMVHRWLLDGVYVRVKSSGEMTRVRLVDLENPVNNEFAFSVGVAFEEAKDKEEPRAVKPSFVLYLNGLPVGIVDVRSSDFPLNWASRMVSPLFTQLVVLVTPEHIQYLHPTDSKRINSVSLSSGRFLSGLETILEPRALLDLILNFLVMIRSVGARESEAFFARPYQIRAVNAALRAIESRKSGSVVLPVGSGKTQVLSLIVNKLQHQNFLGQVVCVTESELLARQLSERLSQFRLASIETLSKKLSHQWGEFRDEHLHTELGSRVVVSSMSNISGGAFPVESNTVFLVLAAKSAKLKKIQRGFQVCCSVITISDTPSTKDLSAGIDDLLYEYSLSDMLKAGQRCAVSFGQCDFGESALEHANSIATHFEIFRKRGTKGFVLVGDQLLSLYEEAFRRQPDIRTLTLIQGTNGAQRTKEKFSQKEFKDCDLILASRIPGPILLAPVQVAYICSEIEQSDDLVRLVASVSQDYSEKKICSLMFVAAQTPLILNKLELLGARKSSEFVESFYKTLVLAEHLCHQFEGPEAAPSDSARATYWSADTLRLRLDHTIDQLQEMFAILQNEDEFHDIKVRCARVLEFHVHLIEPISKKDAPKKAKLVRHVADDELSTGVRLTQDTLQQPIEDEIRAAASCLSQECDAKAIAITATSILVEAAGINWHRRSDVILRIISLLTSTFVSMDFPESSIPSLVRRLVQIATKLQLQIDADSMS